MVSVEFENFRYTELTRSFAPFQGAALFRLPRGVIGTVNGVDKLFVKRSSTGLLGR